MDIKLLKKLKKKSSLPSSINLPFTESHFNQLLNEFNLIHLIYHRNKNQHHVSNWWKFLNLIHRNLRKFLFIIMDINELIHFNNISKINYSKICKNFKVIKKFKKMDKNSTLLLLNNKLILFNKQLLYLKKSIKSSYWNFMNIIQLAQFVNIGFALIAILSKINNILLNIENIDTNIENIDTNIIENNIIELPSNDRDNEDIGEILIENNQIEELEEIVEVPNEISEPVIESIELTPKKKKKSLKSKSKSKSHSAIDDIFGF